MLNFCDFIHVFVFTRNHHLKRIFFLIVLEGRTSFYSRRNTVQILVQAPHATNALRRSFEIMLLLDKFSVFLSILRNALF